MRVNNRNVGRPRPRHRCRACTRGYDLALTELSTAVLKDTLAEPAVASRKAVAIALDLRSQDSIKSAFERATQDLGDIDLW